MLSSVLEHLNIRFIPSTLIKEELWETMLTSKRLCLLDVFYFSYNRLGSIDIFEIYASLISQLGSLFDFIEDCFMDGINTLLNFSKWTILWSSSVGKLNTVFKELVSWGFWVWTFKLGFVLDKANAPFHKTYFRVLFNLIVDLFIMIKHWNISKKVFRIQLNKLLNSIAVMPFV